LILFIQKIEATATTLFTFAGLSDLGMMNGSALRHHFCILGWERKIWRSL